MSRPMPFARMCWRGWRRQSRRSPPAGSMTAPAPSCSTRSPSCRLTIRRGPRPRCCSSIMPEAAALIPKGAAVVEFGAGSATKTPILLDAIRPAAYVPVDISGDYLEESAAQLSSDFPGLPVLPVTADFTRPFALPDLGRRPAQARLLPRLDHRQFRAAQRDRPAAPFPRIARHRRAAADRHGPGEADRTADRRL